MSADTPSSISTSSNMRRRAKTPVFAVGQLEGFLGGCDEDAIASDKISDGDLVTNHYRTFVESRDTDSVYSDSHSEPSPSRQGHRHDEWQPRRRGSFELPPQPLFHSSPITADLALSPTSDDGTLVAFDEEAVYFKPISFSPEPRSPAGYSPARSPMHSYEAPVQIPQLPPDNLSLQICLDLLTRELSSAMLARPNRAGNEASSLQVWVMIEAFERLRDLVTSMRLRHGNAGMTGVETMFDTWLQALYSIHDSLAEEGRFSESDYETVELGEPLD